MKCKPDELLIHHRSIRKSQPTLKSIACLTSNITIVCIVIGYIIAGGFLFNYMEAEEEYKRLKLGSDQVRRQKERFLSENKRQLQTFKSKLMEQTREYFGQLRGAIDEIDSQRPMTMGRSPTINKSKIENKPMDKLIKLVKNMSFLHVESFGAPALRTFNRTNSKVTDNFIEAIYNTTINGFAVNFDENNTTLWTLPGSILYSVTVITTVGYGNIVPKTNSGKIATIIYAMFGIPLMLLCMANLGSVVADLLKVVYNFIINTSKCRQTKPHPRSQSCTPECQMKKYRDCGRSVSVPNKLIVGKDLSVLTSHSTNITKITECNYKNDQKLNITVSIDAADFVTNLQKEPDQDLPLMFPLVAFLVYILVGAVLIMRWEGWEYLNCVYYVFITFSTIGFGDLVPGSLNYQWTNQMKPICCAIYLLLGLILLSVCFQLIQDSVRKRARRMGQHIGLINENTSV